MHCSNRCIIIGPCVDCYGSTHRLLGLLAAGLERGDDAERHFQDAMEMNARMKAGRFAGWAFHQYADMLLRRDGPGDRAEAGSLLAQGPGGGGWGGGGGPLGAAGARS